MDTAAILLPITLTLHYPRQITLEFTFFHTVQQVIDVTTELKGWAALA